MLIYAHDHIFISINDEIYSSGSFPSDVISRYTTFFGQTIFICRMKEIKYSKNQYSKISNNDISFKPINNIRSIKGFFHIRKAQKKIHSYLNKADYIIVRLPSALGLMVYYEATKKGIPVLVEVVGNAYESNLMHGNPLGKLIAPIEHFLTKRAIAHSKNVIYITNSYLQDIYPSNGSIYICPNVNIKSVLVKTLHDRQTKIIKSFPLKSVKIGLIGSLDVNYKGHEVAIKVISLLKKKYPKTEWSLHFAGKGSREKWQTIAKNYNVADNVFFEGIISSGQNMHNWLDSLDILFQPSKVEAQGRSIIEGMSRGLPVIASDAGGIIELLEKTHITTPLDVDGFVNIITTLIKDKDNLLKTSNRNFEFAKDFYVENIEVNRKKAFEKYLLHCSRLKNNERKNDD